jgi:hypothetical protein
MGLLERMTECVTGTAFISRFETAAAASNIGAANEVDRLVCPQFAGLQCGLAEGRESSHSKRKMTGHLRSFE